MITKCCSRINEWGRWAHVAQNKILTAVFMIHVLYR